MPTYRQRRMPTVRTGSWDMCVYIWTVSEQGIVLVLTRLHRWWDIVESTGRPVVSCVTLLPAQYMCSRLCMLTREITATASQVCGFSWRPGLFSAFWHLTFTHLFPHFSLNVRRQRIYLYVYTESSLQMYNCIYTEWSKKWKPVTFCL